MNDIIILLLLIFGVMFIVIGITIGISQKKLAQLERYMEIDLGMSENKMLAIMGEGYNRSLLKNNRVKYEWRINATSVGSSYKGISTRSYSGVKKVTIYVKDGLVEEVRPYNV